MDRFLSLSAFVETVERGSQAAAARELDLTPAMVGRHIRALEDRLGARLLNRTTARQSLTEAGTAFYARAAAVLDQLQAAEHAAADPGAVPRGTLRVNGPMSFGVRVLADAVAAFCRVQPAVQVELVLNDRVVDLVEEGYDVAVRIGQLADSSLVARRLATCSFVVCASPGYLRRAGGAPATPAELRRHDCLVYTYGSGGGDGWTFRDAAGAEQHVRLSGSLTANNGDALLAAALAGLGVIVQPSFIVGEAVRDGRLVALLPGWRLPDLPVHAVFPSARHLAPKVRALVDFLLSRFRDPPWEAAATAPPAAAAPPPSTAPGPAPRA